MSTTQPPSIPSMTPQPPYVPEDNRDGFAFSAPARRRVKTPVSTFQMEDRSDGTGRRWPESVQAIWRWKGRRTVAR